MLVLVALLAICAPLISAATGHNPYNPDLVNGTNSFGQPYGPGQAGFLLGTDNLGRDILVRIAYGARISLLVGVLATAIATIGGTGLGLVSGYFGGWIDAVLARLMDTVLSFPYVLLAIVLAAVFGGSLALTIGVIAFFSWAAIGRIVRGQTLSQKEKEYVEAARSIGAAPSGSCSSTSCPTWSRRCWCSAPCWSRWRSSSRPPSTTSGWGWGRRPRPGATCSPTTRARRASGRGGSGSSPPSPC